MRNIPTKVLIFSFVLIVILTGTIYFVIQGYDNVRQRRIQFVEQRVKNDPVVRKELHDHKILADQIEQEAEACDRLHLSHAERTKRIQAVYEAGMAEMNRVRATHYHSPFQPPATD